MWSKIWWKLETSIAIRLLSTGGTNTASHLLFMDLPPRASKQHFWYCFNISSTRIQTSRRFQVTLFRTYADCSKDTLWPLLIRRGRTVSSVYSCPETFSAQRKETEFSIHFLSLFLLCHHHQRLLGLRCLQRVTLPRLVQGRRLFGGAAKLPGKIERLTFQGNRSHQAGHGDALEEF